MISQHFEVIKSGLLRQGIDDILRMCMSAIKVPLILAACHDSVYGGHFSRQLIG